MDIENSAFFFFFAEFELSGHKFRIFYCTESETNAHNRAEPLDLKF